MAAVTAAGAVGSPASAGPGPALTAPESVELTLSARTGLAVPRSRSSLICSSDAFSPIAIVTAATPTISAPSVIAARGTWLSPLATPSRMGRPNGQAHAQQASAARSGR